MRISDWSSYVFSSDLPGLHVLVVFGIPGEGRGGFGVSLRGAGIGDSGFGNPARGALCFIASGNRAFAFPNPESPIPNPRPTHARLRLQEPAQGRSEEHTSELQSLMRISYAVFCLKKKK